MGIIDDYFDGYYSEEMIESQVIFCLTLFSPSWLIYTIFLLSPKWVKVIDGIIMF